MGAMKQFYLFYCFISGVLMNLSI